MTTPDLPERQAASDSSLGELALRLVIAIARVAWRKAARVLSVGDCNVH